MSTTLRIFLGIKTGVTKVYARATQSVLEAAVEKLTKPLSHVVELDEKPDKGVAHLPRI